MKKSGLYAYGLGVWEPPELTESEILAIEVGLLVGAQKTAKPRGAPKLPDYHDKDSRRAFAIWALIKLNPEKKLATKSTRDLIQIAQGAEEILGIAGAERLFPVAGNFDSSVSRGKGNLGIDDDWHSKVCEEIQGI